MADGSRTFEMGPADRTPRLAAVYRSHAPYVWRVLRHIGVADGDLDDAVQETFLVVHRRLDEFEGRASLRTWLYAVAVRVASTQRRSEKREVARREVAGAGVHASSTIDPETELGRAEAADILDALLSELDLAKRTVFVLAEIEGVKVPEIAKILGVNVHTVHSRLRLAREGFEAAVRRMQAREDGRMLRSQARRAVKSNAIRTMLVERAANDDVPSARRRAAFAALAIRIDEGAVPKLAGWQSVSIAAPSLVPAFAAGVIGTIALGWIGATAATPKSTPRVDTVAAVAPATSDTTPTPALLPSELPPAEPTPIAIAEEVPRQRPSPRPAASPLEPAPTPTLEAETALLSEALTALRNQDAKAALATLDRFDREFPNAVLQAETRKARRRAQCMNGDSASC